MKNFGIALNLGMHIVTKYLKWGLFLLLLWACNNPSQQGVITGSSANTGFSAPSQFNPHPKYVRYSRHARCRMECRHITEQEIAEIIAHGKIDYRKSNLQADDCHKRYALEGITAENQYLRVIVAECNDVLTVITCIDLRTEWPCNCN